MRVVAPGYEILRPNMEGIEGREAIYRMIELAGRTCYKSEDKMTKDSAARFVSRIVRQGHEAMLEHANMTVRFTVDRAIANEIVRHRICSFAQESTRYCDYSTERFHRNVTFIKPFFFDGKENTEKRNLWIDACLEAEKQYFQLIDCGCSAQEARVVLPLCTKTELVVTANMREWRHFFRLRAEGVTGAPHPQMAEVAKPLLKQCKAYLPELFSDIGGDQ